MKYQVECFDDVIGEIKPLLEKHWQEIAMYKDRINLNPDYGKYKSMEDIGALHIVTVREDSNKLIGYFISMVIPNIHYKDNLFAVNDILYIDPSYRGKSVGIKMFKFAEQELRNLGVDVITLHSKTYMDLGKLVGRLGYEHVENNYAKYIGK